MHSDHLHNDQRNLTRAAQIRGGSQTSRVDDKAQHGLRHFWVLNNGNYYFCPCLSIATVSRMSLVNPGSSFLMPKEGLCWCKLLVNLTSSGLDIASFKISSIW